MSTSCIVVDHNLGVTALKQLLMDMEFNTIAVQITKVVITETTVISFKYGRRLFGVQLSKCQLYIMTMYDAIIWFKRSNHYSVFPE
jgi:hypothetical protein